MSSVLGTRKFEMAVVTQSTNCNPSLVEVLLKSLALEKHRNY